MSFKDKLTKSISEQAAWKRRPELLLLPQIPKPMHGLAPRVVLGGQWWDKTRQEAYRSTNFHCAACGVHKSQAKGPKWLEGHEVYNTDYKKGRLIYLETVPLCNYCHNFIHVGRLQALLEHRKITTARFAAVIQHGERVLAEAGIVHNKSYEEQETTGWSEWRLVVFGKEYPPLCKSLQEWLAKFGGNNASLEEEDY